MLITQSVPAQNASCAEESAKPPAERALTLREAPSEAREIK